LHCEEKQQVSSSQWINEIRMLEEECATTGSAKAVSDNLSVRHSDDSFFRSLKTNPVSTRLKVPTATLAMVTVAPLVPTTTIALTGFSALLNAISLRRKLLLKEHSIQLKTIVTLLASVWKMDTVKAAKAVWRTGGGQKNIGWTLTVMTAVTIFLLRPLLQAVGGSGATSVIRSAL
jgi:hypothetical protein